MYDEYAVCESRHILVLFAGIMNLHINDIIVLNQDDIDHYVRKEGFLAFKDDKAKFL
jgi:hypothetical protein